MTLNNCSFCGTPCEDSFCSVQCKLEYIGAEDTEGAGIQMMNEPYSGYKEL